jgi:hypothetical protein
MTGMRVLAIGSGGVGTSAALIAARRDFFETWICADYDEARACGLADRVGDARFTGIALDASDESAVAEACRSHGITHVRILLELTVPHAPGRRWPTKCGRWPVEVGANCRPYCGRGNSNGRASKGAAFQLGIGRRVLSEVSRKATAQSTAGRPEEARAMRGGLGVDGSAAELAQAAGQAK